MRVTVLTRKEKRPRVRVVAATLFILLAVLIAALVLFVREMQQTMKEETERYLCEISNGMANTMDIQLATRLSILESLAITYAEQKRLGIVDMEYLQSKAAFSNFVSLWIMDFDGKAVGTNGKTYDFRNIPEVFPALEGTRVVFNDDNENFSFGGTHNGFAFAVPIYENGGITGALVASNTTESVKSMLAQTYFQGDGFFHVVEADGTFVIRSSSPNATVQGTNCLTSLAEDACFYNDTSVEDVREALASQTPITFYFADKEDGVGKVGRIVPLTESGFYLFQVVVEKTVTSPFDSLLSHAIVLNGTVALLFLLLIAALVLTYGRHSKRMETLAFVDPVTGGYTHTRFEMEAAALLRSAPSGTYTFLTLNIVNFILINDTFGTEKGDATLKYVHSVLARHLKSGELLCRWSADDFNLLIRSNARERLEEWLQNLTDDINRYNDGAEDVYRMSMTAGIYQVFDTNSPVIRIRNRANAARKKCPLGGMTIENGLASYAIYSDADRLRQKHEKNMENKMQRALDKGEFIVYLQPKADPASMRITGAEALVRWMDPEEGLIPPNTFIPFFERNHFVLKVDLYVFEQVCRYIRSWMDAGITPVPVSFNFSRIHLDNPCFLQRYIEIQQRYGVPPELLEFEFTESVMLTNAEVVTEVISQIHRAGFHCSMDDFGSDYSSLNMLKSVYIDTLKLDKSFLNATQTDDARSRTIIVSIVEMARRLGIKTVSEGVETKEQLSFLQSVGCDMVQGYLIAKPMPEDQFTRMAFQKPESSI